MQHDLLRYVLHAFVFFLIQDNSILRIQAGHPRVRLGLGFTFKTTFSGLIFLCGDNESRHGRDTVSKVYCPATLSPSSVSAALARLSFKI